MSDLKHQDLYELNKRETDTLKYIGVMKGKINNMEERLRWIRHYKGLKTRKDMTIEEIEYRLGYSVRVIGGGTDGDT